MRRRLALIGIVFVVALAFSGAQAQDAPRDLAGRWTGQCYNCPVRSFILVLRQDGEQLAGMLQAIGRTGLGEKEMPLVTGKISGRSVSFRVIGADGMALDSTLTLSRDGQTMEGQGRHRASFGLSFSRAGS